MSRDYLCSAWPIFLGFLLFSLLIMASSALSANVEAISPVAGKTSYAMGEGSNVSAASVQSMEEAGLSRDPLARTGVAVGIPAYRSSYGITGASPGFSELRFPKTGPATHPIAVITSFSSMYDPAVLESQSAQPSIPLLEIPTLGGELALHTGVDTHMDDAILGYQKGWTNSLIYEHHLFARGLTGYVELYSDNDFYNDSLWVGTVGLGVVYAPGENVRITAGIELGLTEGVSGLSPFFGFSIPF